MSKSHPTTTSHPPPNFPSHLHNSHRHHPHTFTQEITKIQIPLEPVFNLSYFNGFSSIAPEDTSQVITRETASPAAPATAKKKMTSDNDKKGFTSKISYAKQYQVYVCSSHSLSLGFSERGKMGTCWADSESTVQRRTRG
ncbi:hypothetical protein L873DRAFT_516413 [Choiromyces venosus 120613-1]|uniref:Uncharacterized protein n=1 Tax=Choiromyces venosus 120613-1 TaxID=1336337 RepID=A0A3N4K4U7_9PEZI|nr:hypothetical protein L873DRAFT_516413 [Choiromyces venosus 120613-1]